MSRRIRLLNASQMAVPQKSESTSSRTAATLHLGNRTSGYHECSSFCRETIAIRYPPESIGPPKDARENALISSRRISHLVSPHHLCCTPPTNHELPPVAATRSDELWWSCDAADMGNIVRCLQSGYRHQAVQVSSNFAGRAADALPNRAGLDARPAESLSTWTWC